MYTLIMKFTKCEPIEREFEMENLKLKPEAIRVQLGLTQEQFAEKIGLSSKVYQNRLAGTDWKAKEIAKICDLSGLKFEDIDFNLN